MGGGEGAVLPLASRRLRQAARCPAGAHAQHTPKWCAPAWPHNKRHAGATACTTPAGATRSALKFHWWCPCLPSLMRLVQYASYCSSKGTAGRVKGYMHCCAVLLHMYCCAVCTSAVPLLCPTRGLHQTGACHPRCQQPAAANWSSGPSCSSSLPTDDPMNGKDPEVLARW